MNFNSKTRIEDWHSNKYQITTFYLQVGKILSLITLNDVTNK